MIKRCTANEDECCGEAGGLLDDGGVSDVPLGPKDYQSVLHAGRTLHQRGWSKVCTLSKQVNAWQHMVDSVEKGYSP